MKKRFQCPKCAGTTFSATAHVTQIWMLDGNGEFIESISNCVDITHRPDDEDLWECLSCEYQDAGAKFIKGDI